MRIIGQRLYFHPGEHSSRVKCIGGSGYDWGLKMYYAPLAQKDTIIAFFPETKKVLSTIEPHKYTWPKHENTNQASSRVNLEGYVFMRRPYNHQVEAMRAIIGQRQHALFMEQGTGKTLPAITAFEWLHQRGRVKRMLVIAPKTLLLNWHDEVGMNSRLSSSVIEGTKSQRMKLLSDDNPIHIINYDGMAVCKEHNWDMYDYVVLDESQYIKTHKTQRTKFIVKLFSTRDIYKVVCTGTPVTQNPLDIYSQFEFLNKQFLNMSSWYAHRARYVRMGGYGGYEIVGFQNISELTEKIARHSTQTKKVDCLDLPEKVWSKRVVEMTPLMAKQYQDMRDDMVIDLQNTLGRGEVVTAQIILTKMLRLQEILAGAYVKPEENAKLAAVREAVAIAMESGQQIVIFANFRKSIEVLEKMLNAKDFMIPYSIIHGDISDRADQVKRFQSGDTKVFIGSLAAASEGITLTASSTIYYYENTFKLTNRLQADARIHRIGQTQKCQYIDFVYRDTIDEQVLEAISSKQDIAETLVKSFTKINLGSAA